MVQNASAQAVYDRAVERAGDIGKSPRQVSIDATGKPDAFTAIRRGSIPKQRRAEELARHLLTTVDWLLYGTGLREVPEVVADSRWLYRAQGPAEVPVYGTAHGASAEELGLGDDGYAEVEVTNIYQQEIVGWLKRPPGIDPRAVVWGLYTVGDSMSPRFEDRDPILIDEKTPPAAGEDVVVQIRDAQDGTIRAALLKRLVRRTAREIVLRQFNPPIEFRIEADRVHSLHRVVPIAELLGLR